MRLFQKTKQHITISAEAHGALEAFVAELAKRNLKDVKISSVKQVENEWQCSISCKLEQ